jgi:hypothetical protein
MDIERIIKTGDRADLKKFLASCTDQELADVWVKLSCCKVQDFSELTTAEMRRRKMIREVRR